RRRFCLDIVVACAAVSFCLFSSLSLSLPPLLRAFCFSVLPRPPTAPLSPYPTLFRSHRTSLVRCRSESSVDDPTPTSLLGVPCLCGASSRLAWLALSSGKGTVSTAETHERFKPF